MATELSSKTFGEAVKKPVALVDFWAPWCMPCVMLAPIIDQLSEEYRGRVFVGKVNVDDEQDLAQKYGVMSIPNLIIFKNGKVVDNVVGALPKARLKEMLEKQLK